MNEKTLRALIEAGAVKEHTCDGRELGRVVINDMQPIYGTGGHVTFIAMDEPFTAVQAPTSQQQGLREEVQLSGYELDVNFFEILRTCWFHCLPPHLAPGQSDGLSTVYGRYMAMSSVVFLYSGHLRALIF